MRLPIGSAALGSFVTIAVLVAVPASVGSVVGAGQWAAASPPGSAVAGSVDVGSAVGEPAAPPAQPAPPGERRAKRLFTDGCHYGRGGVSLGGGRVGGGDGGGRH